MPLTDDAPKCYAQIGGRRILDWCLDALGGAGLDEIVFIGGYRMEPRPGRLSVAALPAQCGLGAEQYPGLPALRRARHGRRLRVELRRHPVHAGGGARPRRESRRHRAPRRHRLAGALPPAHAAPRVGRGEDAHPRRARRRGQPRDPAGRGAGGVHRRGQVQPPRAPGSSSSTTRAPAARRKAGRSARLPPSPRRT